MHKASGFSEDVVSDLETTRSFRNTSTQSASMLFLKFSNLTIFNMWLSITFWQSNFGVFGAELAAAASLDF